MTSYEAIMRAAERLAGKAVCTPLLESDRLNGQLGCRVLVKAECLQRAGAFKFRGAFNAIRAMMEADPEIMARKGVIAYSSGNHAQAVALAARMNGLQAIIVMPEDAPTVKIDNTRGYGGQVVTYNRLTESREAIARQIAHETGAIVIPPFDHPEVIAGQGTVGLEIVDQCRERNLQPDMLLVPCSGGGLLAGVGLAVRHAFPGTNLYAVEPEGYDDTRQSLEQGRRVKISPGISSLCDALLLSEPGVLTFEINCRQLSGALTVTDSEALSAMACTVHEFKLVLEPGGAVALAAVLGGKLDVKDKTVVVVASGGNVAPEILTLALNEPALASGR